MQPMKLGLAFASVMLVAGCTTTGTPRNVSGLESGLPKAPCKVRSTTRVGQQWVDETIAAETVGFGWPAPRVKCADPKPMVVKAPVVPPAGQVIAPPPRVETKIEPQQPAEPRKPAADTAPGPPTKPTRAECTARADQIKWETAIGRYWRKGRWTWIRKCMRGEV